MRPEACRTDEPGETVMPDSLKPFSKFPCHGMRREWYPVFLYFQYFGLSDDSVEMESLNIVQLFRYFLHYFGGTGNFDHKNP